MTRQDLKNKKKHGFQESTDVFFKKKFAENTCQESGFLEISKEMLQFLWEVDVSLRQLRDIVGDPERPCGHP